MIQPLRKTRKKKPGEQEGELYTRDPRIEAKLAELVTLPPDALVARSAITQPDDPGYVPSECLLYLVRARRGDEPDAHFARLYRLLLERVLRRLPRAEHPDGQTESRTNVDVRAAVAGRFAELLASDRAAYCERLDYFEVRFDGALASLRLDARKRVWRDEDRYVALDADAATGEPTPEVERAAIREAEGAFDPWRGPASDAHADADDYRSRLDTAIDALPPEQRRVVEMIRQGIPIDSKEADVVTIARVLQRSEKTVRNYRDRAFATLRAALAGAAR